MHSRYTTYYQHQSIVCCAPGPSRACQNLRHQPVKEVQSWCRPEDGASSHKHTHTHTQRAKVMSLSRQTFTVTVYPTFVLGMRQALQVMCTLESSKENYWFSYLGVLKSPAAKLHSSGQLYGLQRLSSDGLTTLNNDDDAKEYKNVLQSGDMDALQ